MSSAAGTPAAKIAGSIMVAGENLVTNWVNQVPLINGVEIYILNREDRKEKVYWLI